jgi:hypothetical protein
MARPTRLKYTGQYLNFGHGQPEPDRHYQGVPARDLTEEDLAQFSDEDIKLIMGGTNPLYVDTNAAPSQTGLQAMKVEELRAEARKRGVDLGGAKKKDDIISRLESADSDAERVKKAPVKQATSKQSPPPEAEPEPVPAPEPVADAEPMLFEDVGEPTTHESA